MRELKILKSITNRQDDSLNRYLNDIAQIQMISPKEEVMLAKKIKSGDRSAEHKLITANLRFVISCAKKYSGKGVALADLVNEGNLGLIKAARLFDETKGFKFISFAVWWIRQAMIHYLNEHQRMIRLPMNQQLAITSIHKQAELLEQQLERKPSLEELAETTGKTVGQLLDAIDSSQITVSYDDFLPGQDKESLTLLGTLADKQARATEDYIRDEALRHQLNLIISNLTPRERSVIEMSFGVSGQVKMANEDIAETLKLSAERVRQIKQYAMTKLRKMPKPDYLQDIA